MTLTLHYTEIQVKNIFKLRFTKGESNNYDFITKI